MMPWEREVYISMLITHLKEKAEKAFSLTPAPRLDSSLILAPFARTPAPAHSASLPPRFGVAPRLRLPRRNRCALRSVVVVAAHERTTSRGD